MIHGTLDRIMQLLDVPFNEKRIENGGYYIEPSEGEVIGRVEMKKR